ncbi:hypothetical protein CRM22_001007 [Opisthorchis felineus]|uniref:Uncharacterized protein n=1 Tax=Opisthorchis felineus TaxID=147828 RepID=A0A4S2MGN8_OPIFE|nr:hypothetical protein CRM22_001007 [Opisthorchis felineus]
MKEKLVCAICLGSRMEEMVNRPRSLKIMPGCIEVMKNDEADDETNLCAKIFGRLRKMLAMKLFFLLWPPLKAYIDMYTNTHTMMIKRGWLADMLEGGWPDFIVLNKKWIYLQIEGRDSLTHRRREVSLYVTLALGCSLTSSTRTTDGQTVFLQARTLKAATIQFSVFLWRPNTFYTGENKEFQEVARTLHCVQVDNFSGPYAILEAPEDSQ